MSTKPKQFRKRARDSDDEEETDTNRNKAGVSSLLSSSSSSSASGTTISNVPPLPSSSIATSSSTTTTDKKGITSFSTSSSIHSRDPHNPSSLSDVNDAIVSGASIAYTTTGTGTAYQYGGGAFSYNEINTSETQDARAALEKKLQLQEQAITDIEQGKRIYRGLVGYTNFQQQKGTTEEIISQAKISGTIGPVRAPTNVRGICRIDYQPDVCKDYKETGQCSFGDACIYLHDRSDYKNGWQIEMEWQKKQKRKADKLAERLAQGKSIEDISDSDSEEDGNGNRRTKNNGGNTDDPNATTGGDYSVRRWKVGLGNSKYSKHYATTQSTDGNGGHASKTHDHTEEKDLPFACFICRKPFVSPVQTQCGHYFCEQCAIQRHRNFPLCAVCGKPTLGIFSAAPKLEARIKELGNDRAVNDDDDEEEGTKGTKSSNGTNGWEVIDDEANAEKSKEEGTGWSTVPEEPKDENAATPSSPVGDSDASTDKESGTTTHLSSSSRNVQKI